MPGSRVAVIVTGNELSPSGKRFSGYRTAVKELNLGRSQYQRHLDRQELKAGGVLRINGYVLKRAH